MRVPVSEVLPETIQRVVITRSEAVEDKMRRDSKSQNIMIPSVISFGRRDIRAGGARRSWM